MCGLVGMVFGKSAAYAQKSQATKILSVLLDLDTYRGHHGTGVVSVRPGKTTGFTAYYSKAAVPGNHFIHTKQYLNFTTGLSDSAAVLGHNRYATMGGHSKEAAHPHVDNNIILTHNGTLTRFDHLAKKPGGLNDLDSARVAYEMESKGSGKEALENLNGAYALVWYDNRTESVYIARNEDRPLFYGVFDKQILMYASNKWMLDAVGTILKLDAEIYPQAVPKEIMWQIDLNEFNVEYGDDKQQKTYSFKGVTKVPFVNTKPIHHPYSHNYTGKSSQTTWNNANNYHAGHASPLVVVPFGEAQTEIERSNTVLSGTGFVCGQEVEIMLDYVHFGTQKAKKNGIGFGVTMDKPSLSVVLVGVDKKLLMDDAYSYTATILGAALKQKAGQDDITLYCSVKEVNKLAIDPEDYSNVVVGNGDLKTQVEALLGNSIVIDVGQHEIEPGPMGVPLLLPLYNQFIEKGCIACGESLKNADPKAISWSAHNNPICPGCTEINKDKSIVYIDDYDRSAALEVM